MAWSPDRPFTEAASHDGGGACGVAVVALPIVVPIALAFTLLRAYAKR